MMQSSIGEIAQPPASITAGAIEEDDSSLPEAPEAEVVDENNEDVVEENNEDHDVAAPLNGHEESVDLGQLDVLLGRGTGPTQHAGNIRYRHLVRQVLKRPDHYFQSTTPHIEPSSQHPPMEYNKYLLANHVVQTIKSRGGRFLARSLSPGDVASTPRLYHVVEDRIAIEKTRQSFRHQLRTIGRKAENANRNNVLDDPSSKLALLGQRNGNAILEHPQIGGNLNFFPSHAQQHIFNASSNNNLLNCLQNLCGGAAAAAQQGFPPLRTAAELQRKEHISRSFSALPSHYESQLPAQSDLARQLRSIQERHGSGIAAAAARASSSETRQDMENLSRRLSDVQRGFMMNPNNAPMLASSEREQTQQLLSEVQRGFMRTPSAPVILSPTQLQTIQERVSSSETQQDLENLSRRLSNIERGFVRAPNNPPMLSSEQSQQQQQETPLQQQIARMSPNDRLSIYLVTLQMEQQNQNRF